MTVFVGEKNSGKSSILAMLRSSRLKLFKVKTRRSLLRLMLPLATSVHTKILFTATSGRVQLCWHWTSWIHLRDVAVEEFYFDTEFKHRVRLRQTVLRWVELGEVGADSYEPLLSITTSPDSGRPTVEAIGNTDIAESARATISRTIRMFNFLPRIVELGLAPSRSTDVKDAQALIGEHVTDIRRAYNAAVRTLQHVEYLGAMRKPPERTYVNTGVVGRRIGADGSGWPSVLALESSRRRSLGQDTTSWMRHAGIADSVSVSWLTDRHYEIVVTNPNTGEKENIADVGQGTSQVLPVIVGGSRLARDDVYIVEEPEIHLHPRRRPHWEISSVTWSRGVQCLLETHSEYLLLRLQQKMPPLAHSAQIKLCSTTSILPATRSGLRRSRLIIRRRFVTNYREDSFLSDSKRQQS